MSESDGDSSLQHLLGIGKVPREGIVRDQLDYVSPLEFQRCYEYLLGEMASLGLLEEFRSKLGKLLLLWMGVGRSGRRKFRLIWQSRNLSRVLSRY